MKLPRAAGPSASDRGYEPYIIEDGLLTGAASVIFVGRGRPDASLPESLRGAALVLGSSDSGNTVSVVAILKGYSRISRIAKDQAGTLLLIADQEDTTGPAQSVLKSTDGGVNWELVTLPPDVTQVFSLAVVEEAVWLAVRMDCATSRLIRTPDYGATWDTAVELASADGCASINEVVMHDKTVAASAFSNGQAMVLLSQDAGTDFTTISVPRDKLTSPESIDFTIDEIFVSGYHLPNPSDLNRREYALVHSSLAASEWSSVAIPLESAGDIFFASPQIGAVVAGKSGLPGVLMTRNAGETWKFEALAGADFGLSRLFGNPQMMYAVGVRGAYVSDLVD